MKKKFKCDCGCETYTVEDVGLTCKEVGAFCDECDKEASGEIE